MADHNSFVNSGGDRGSQSDYYNQILPPLILTDDVQKKYSSFIKPDPLHIVKLGVMNDLISSLQTQGSIRQLFRVHSVENILITLLEY